MKKKLIYPLLVCTMLSCSACSQTEKNAKNEVTVEEIPTNDAQKAAVENTAESTVNTKVDETVEITTDESCVAEQPSDIQIDMQTVENEITSEDGTVLLNKSYTYPIVTIAGNPEAAAKINADIQEKIDSFNADTSSADYAKEDLAFYLENADDSFIPYDESLTYEAKRSDSNVISFVITYYAYTGGAHGNIGSHTVNYNPNSGDEIAFSDLSDTPEQFRADTLAYNQKLAASEGYVERLYSPEMATIEELEPGLYSEYSWYLSTSGLVFISDPYALGPYAAGTIEFIIPYADLAQMGFKEEYAYTGNLIVELQDGASYTLDINGDGAEDTVRFYTESTYDDEGNYAESTHFIINDTDLLQGNDTDLTETFRNYAWGGYTLYDLDETDATIELVFYSFEYVDDEYVTYSNLYRYDKDAALTYLGKVEGKVSNPLVDTNNLIR